MVCVCVCVRACVCIRERMCVYLSMYFMYKYIIFDLYQAI